MVIRGRNTETMIVKNVSVTRSSDGGANAAAGMIYYLYAVVWNAANPLLSYRVVPVMTLADLRQGSAAAINLMLN